MVATNSFRISAELSALTDLFAAAPIGATITYEQMKRAVGFDVRDSKRYLILSAIRRARIVTAPVRGVGYQRLTSEEYHTVGGHARRRMRATGQRAQDTIIMGVETTNDISPAARRKAFGEVNNLAIARHILTDKAHATVPESDRPLPVALTLAAMLRGQ
jgi:hypothetical protein